MKVMHHTFTKRVRLCKKAFTCTRSWTKCKVPNKPRSYAHNNTLTKVQIRHRLVWYSPE